MFIDVPTRTSAAVSKLSVDLLSQLVRVTFTNGIEYEYGNVSKRAIANVLFNPDVSLGFWVNNNCVTPSLATNNGRTYLTDVATSPQLPAFV